MEERDASLASTQQIKEGGEGPTHSNLHPRRLKFSSPTECQSLGIYFNSRTPSFLCLSHDHIDSFSKPILLELGERVCFNGI